MSVLHFAWPPTSTLVECILTEAQVNRMIGAEPLPGSQVLQRLLYTAR
jgi:hypothetical protein